MSRKAVEYLLIVSGHATYRVDGEEIDAPGGAFLYVPGAAFAPSEWDTVPLPE